MFRAKIFLLLLSFAALSTGTVLFHYRPTILTFFVAVVLWILGCAMIIVWVASLMFKEKPTSANRTAVELASNTVSHKKAA